MRNDDSHFLERWNELAMPPAVFARHLDAGRLGESWRHSLDAVDELTIGIHYGSTSRIDFAAHAMREFQSDRSCESPPPQLLRVGQSTASRVHVEKLTLDGNRAYGSITMPEKQLDALMSAIYRNRSAALDSR